MIAAIIPARGGSKGVPRKNLRVLGGKPLVVHSILHAMESPSVDRVLVSTDDEEIAGVSSAYGAEIVMRPREISGDQASSESALLHALDYCSRSVGQDPELVVFLQATSPLRPPGSVESAIVALRRANADSLFSSCPLEWFVWRRQGGELAPLNYDHRRRVRRQDAPEDVIENGSLYVFRPQILREHGNRLGGRIANLPMQLRHSFQIDSQTDLEFFQLLFREAAFEPETQGLRNVKLLAFDFAGALTNDSVSIDGDARESAVIALQRAGVTVQLVSKRRNPLMEARCRTLGIPYAYGGGEKAGALRRLAEASGLHAHQVAFIGCDTSDVACLEWAGCPIAAADALLPARSAARWVTRAAGGAGALREVADRLLEGVELLASFPSAAKVAVGEAKEIFA